MRIWMMALALALTGCASQSWEVQQMRNADPDCAEAAGLRTRDAWINGVDRQMQPLIWQDAYKTCVAAKKQTIVVGF